MSSKHGPDYHSAITKITPAVTRIISGAAFGSALALSGVYIPSVIISQMQLQNFHMLQTFLTASAISVIAVQYATKIGYCPPQARKPSTFSRLPPYSGNIVGGVLIGISMAFIGACPGTLIVQGALGSLSGLRIGLGGLLGGIAFVKLAPLLQHTSTTPISSGAQPQVCGAETASNIPLEQPAQHTLPAKLGLQTTTVILAYEALCLTAITLAATLLPTDPTPNKPILGGLAIGAAQTLSILLDHKPIGVSTAYDQLGREIWHTMAPSTHAKPASHSTIWFAVGIIIGAKALTSLWPVLVVPGLATPQLGAVSSVVGGAVMIFGALLAGGCTSGHGISGMATLSVASFVTVAAMFGGGIAWKAVLG